MLARPARPDRASREHGLELHARADAEDRPSRRPDRLAEPLELAGIVSRPRGRGAAEHHAARVPKPFRIEVLVVRDLDRVAGCDRDALAEPLVVSSPCLRQSVPCAR